MSVVLGVCAALASLGAGLLAVAAWLWVSRRRTSIPGPPTLPLLGNALMFVKLPVLWDRLGELHSRYGDIFRLYMGPKLVIVLTRPEDVQSVLLTSKAREREPYLVSVLSTFLGDGLVISKGEVWKTQRKHTELAFHTAELKKFMDKFNECGNFFCELLAEHNGSEVDLYQKLLHVSLRALAGNIFDVELEGMFPNRQKQVEAVVVMTDFAKSVSEILFRPWSTLNLISGMTAAGRKLRSYKTITTNLVDDGIRLVTKNLASIKANDRTFLTALLPDKKSPQKFTNDEIRDQVITLIAAGMDTTATSMGYILTLLGLYPEWQERARRELSDYFGNGDDYLRPVTIADLAQLPVLDAIVKETMRLFSAAPVSPYLMTEDTPLAGDRHVAPRGSCVLVALFLMHRHSQLFPEPLKFDPGRFLEGGSAADRKANSYIPFGIGSRKCVGARYAIHQMKTILAVVLRRYQILPGSTREELEASVISITAHPVTDFRITCVPRDNIP